MSERLLRLASAAAAEGAATATHHVMDTWRVRWELDGLHVKVDGRAWDAQEPPTAAEPGQWGRCAAPAQGQVFWPQRMEAAVADQLYPRGSDEPAPREDSIARASARHVVEDLKRMLREQWFGGARLEEIGGLQPISRWDAMTFIEIAVGGASVLAFVPAVGPAVSTGGAALPSLAPVPQQSFHAASVRVELVVGHVDIALPDAAALQVGDVIVLDAKLTDAMELRIEGAPPALNAYLGHLGTQRALQIASNPPKHGVPQ